MNEENTSLADSDVSCSIDKTRTSKRKRNHPSASPRFPGMVSKFYFNVKLIFS